MSAAGSPGPHPALDAAEVDALLTVLARHARELTGWGPVTLAAGAVSLQLGEPTTGAPTDPATTAGEAPPPRPTPHLAAVPPVPGVTPEAVLDGVAARDADGPVVRSTTVGVFYRASEPGAPPFVSEGDEITVGQQVGIVEAMKLMIPLEADRAGRVAAVLVADGEAVEHGQPVLRLAGS